MEPLTRVTFDRNHMESLRAAKRALEAEKRVLEHHRGDASYVSLQINDLDELLDRMSEAVGAQRALGAVAR